MKNIIFIFLLSFSFYFTSCSLLFNPRSHKYGSEICFQTDGVWSSWSTYNNRYIPSLYENELYIYGDAYNWIVKVECVDIETPYKDDGWNKYSCNITYRTFSNGSLKQSLEGRGFEKKRIRTKTSKGEIWVAKGTWYQINRKCINVFVYNADCNFGLTPKQKYIYY